MRSGGASTEITVYSTDVRDDHRGLRSSARHGHTDALAPKALLKVLCDGSRWPLMAFFGDSTPTEGAPRSNTGPSATGCRDA